MVNDVPGILRSCGQSFPMLTHRVSTVNGSNILLLLIKLSFHLLPYGDQIFQCLGLQMELSYLLSDLLVWY